jgi:EmrB/QacA subfamily drug resistance transporter
VSDARHRTLILVLCCVAQFMVVLDVSIVNVALPSIDDDLGFSADALSWVVNAYTLAFAGFLLLGGRAADLLGRRRVFTGGLLLFGLASLAGGLAQGEGTLVAARAAQGLGGAVVAPSGLSILATTFTEGAERNRAIGLWGTMGALGGASGALFGGLLTETLSWRWVLLINAPVCVVIAVIAARVMPPLAARRGATRSFDLRGALAATGGLVLVTYGIVSSHDHGWGSAATLVPLAAGAALLLLFLVIERRLATAPLVPLRIFRSRSLSGANAVVFCLGAAAISMWFLISLYLQQVLGFSPLHAGLAFAPMSLTIVCVTQLAQRLTTRLGPGRVLPVGMALLGTGMLLFSRIDADGTWARDVLLPSVLCSIGIGCSFVPAMIAATTGVAGQESGLVSGLVNTSFQVGGSVGLALLATIAATHTAAVAGGVSHAVALTEGFQRAFGAGGGFALAGAAVCVAVLTRLRAS